MLDQSPTPLFSLAPIRKSPPRVGALPFPLRDGKRAWLLYNGYQNRSVYEEAAKKPIARTGVVPKFAGPTSLAQTLQLLVEVLDNDDARLRSVRPLDILDHEEALPIRCNVKRPRVSTGRKKVIPAKEWHRSRGYPRRPNSTRLTIMAPSGDT